MKFFLTEIQFGICHLSIVPVRASPSDKSEMTTQLLFGEVFTLLEFSEQEKWVKIQSLHDQYEGWIDSKQFQPISKDYFEAYQHTAHPTTRRGITIVQFQNNSFPIVAGSILPFINEQMEIDLGYTKAEVNNSLEEEITSQKLEGEVLEYAYTYMNAPYLWGGRTHFGIDCSGLTQQIFRAMNISIPRDAWQQALVGDLTALEDATCGDLAFFQNPEGKIVHVGILLEESQILHASGQVRIDKIDKQGIFNTEKNAYSHQLAYIKRINL